MYAKNTLVTVVWLDGMFEKWCVAHEQGILFSTNHWLLDRQDVAHMEGYEGTTITCGNGQRWLDLVINVFLKTTRDRFVIPRKWKKKPWTQGVRCLCHRQRCQDGTSISLRSTVRRDVGKGTMRVDWTRTTMMDDGHVKQKIACAPQS